MATSKGVMGAKGTEVDPSHLWGRLWCNTHTDPENGQDSQWACDQAVPYTNNQDSPPNMEDTLSTNNSVWGQRSNMMAHPG